MAYAPFSQHRQADHDRLPISCSSSSVGLPPITLASNLPHSQLWTVVPEYNISLRKQREINPYENWKCTVQSQISNMDDQLNNLLKQYPDSSTGYFNTNNIREPGSDRRKLQLKDRPGTVTNSLEYGLGRK